MKSLNDFDDIKQRVDYAEALYRDAKDKYYEVMNYAGFANFWK